METTMSPDFSLWMEEAKKAKMRTTTSTTTMETVVEEEFVSGTLLLIIVTVNVNDVNKVWAADDRINTKCFFRCECMNDVHTSKFDQAVAKTFDRLESRKMNLLLFAIRLLFSFWFMAFRGIEIRPSYCFGNILFPRLRPIGASLFWYET